MHDCDACSYITAVQGAKGRGGRNDGLGPNGAPNKERDRDKE